ncbi:MAG: phospholipase D-like domain-containing protein [Pyrinomonadaceae bacterium]
MRIRRSSGGLSVNAIAGTGVVMLGLDLTDAVRAGCLGFAIRRERMDTGEIEWLRGMKSFELTQDDGSDTEGFRSNKHPIQSFQWADYLARPDTEYRFRVTAMYGTPAALVEGPTVSVDVRTEREIADTTQGQKHSVFFNRGAAASQAYARRFNNKYPDDPIQGPGYNAAYKWLSRGLHESLMNFLARATDNTFSLRAAIYEFEWKWTLEAFRDAANLRNVDVQVVYDAIDAKTAKDNREAVADVGIGNLCRERTQGTIMHNKFVVLLKNNVPVAVWTGSTNQTENGIFGHSNVGHIVDDPAIAAKYLDYWTELIKDQADIDQWVETNNPCPTFPLQAPLTAVFSPHIGEDVLKLYATIADNARKALFMTFAFGMNKRFQTVYEKEAGLPRAQRKVINFALMEKEGNGSGLAKGKIDVARIRRRSNVIVALGNRIKMNRFDRWVQEMPKPTRNAGVLWVHTKYMLVDPLGNNPVVVTGSANFSGASTYDNHENMLIIQGDQRTADIYLGEFMRLHSHYAFRETVANQAVWNNNQPEWRPQFLIPDDTWQNGGYFVPGEERFMKRKYFAGKASDVN